MVRRSKVIPSNYKIVQYMLFSLSGFTDWFKEVNMDMVTLLTLDDLYENGEYDEGFYEA